MSEEGVGSSGDGRLQEPRFVLAQPTVVNILPTGIRCNLILTLKCWARNDFPETPNIMLKSV